MSRRAAGLVAGPVAGLVAVALLALSGCGTVGDAPPGGAERGPSEPGDPGLTGTLTVLAAASLTDVFTGFEERLEGANPQLEVRLSFAGSSALATQVLQGAPADVLATADEAQMARVVEAGLASDPQVFAGNSLLLVVPPGNPGGIAVPSAEAEPPSLAEYLDDEAIVAVCAPEVPCGAAAATVLDAAGLSGAPDTYEDDVRAVLTKVQLGEVDAGLVYHSDVIAAGDGLDFYGFAESELAFNRYPVASLSGAANPDAARAFVDLVLSDEGQEALLRAGFILQTR
ncbi:molybdate ABC transporter substrate-binding protein [Blastococcus xanthinilyticus]|uniref:Molybdate transport system substrate-binding protein n=1 Tax=Blastococcus xanthinilyticus TaxID=1564164 RepID=A0A5S5CYL1_9ACTN|nr:molybdate ABC transporter substrate-binding protein [Blastococcus xanthinilyticus]TYP88098.1 molybdate transport system substrate-binding protein [Blastococcus xanthinilyticus]